MDKQISGVGNAIKYMKGTLKTRYDFNEFNKHNIFNRISSQSEYGFYYFPYGYLFRYPKWGTLNSLGFRSKYEIEWIKRNRNDLILCIFSGGSTGFDILVPDEDTIAYGLENELRIMQQKGVLEKDKEVVVLNISQPGNLILNQITNYILFAMELKPDVVISHYGANDIGCGLINDATLLNKYGIGYADVLESWGKAIHESEESIAMDWNTDDRHMKPAPLTNFPRAVIEAMDMRIKQYSNIVKAENSIFIAGFQPWITSKYNHSDDEIKANSIYNPYYKNMYLAAPEAFRQYSQKLKTDVTKSDHGIVDISKCFSGLVSDVTHFGDVCHLTKHGNKICINEYSKALFDQFKQVKGKSSEEND